MYETDYEPRQGQVIGFELLSPRTGSAYVLREEALGGDIEPFGTEERLTALIPIVPASEPGGHELQVIETFNGTEAVIAVLKYTVAPAEFTRQNLTVTQETAALHTQENIQSDNEKVAAAKSATAPRPIWDGLFIQPVEGRITTDFGQERYTNGEYTSRHSAFDIAAPTGTPVAAAADGVVVMADTLHLSGNAVVIDHGMWLYTSYYHLHEISVSVGDTVKAGDIVGTVGSTGYSTGPHLHYAASVKNRAVNPDLLKEMNPLTFE